MSKYKRRMLGLVVAMLMVPVGALAQKQSKVPVLNSISPSSTYAPGSNFTLTAAGSGFTSGSVVRWNGGTRTTTVVGSTQLQAQISSADVASAGTATVTVYTSGRYGGTSSGVSFTIDAAPTTSSTTTTTTSTPTTTTTTTTTTSTTAALAVTTTSVPGGTAGANYSATLAGSGGSPTYTWSLPTGGGAMPPGLALTASGAISGIPSTAGTYSFTAQATDTAGQVAQKAFSVAVAASTTGYLLQDDFESGSLLAWHYTTPAVSFGTISSTTSAVSSNTAPASVLAGSYAMHMRFYVCGDSTNSACGAASQDDSQYVDRAFKTSTGYENGLSDVYVSGHVMYHQNPGGVGNAAQRKIFYLKAPGNTSPYYQNYNWAVIVRTGIGTYDYTLTFDGGPNNPCGNQGATSFNNLGSWTWDTWSWVQVYVHANTPGLSDGALSLWVDGNQVFNRTGLNLRGGCTTGLSDINVGFQVNRYNYNVVDEDRYWDNVAISPSPINY